MCKLITLFQKKQQVADQLYRRVVLGMTVQK